MRPRTLAIPKPRRGSGIRYISVESMNDPNKSTHSLLFSFFPSISCLEFPMDKSKWLLNDTQLVLQENHCPPAPQVTPPISLHLGKGHHHQECRVTYDSSFLLIPLLGISASPRVATSWTRITIPFSRLNHDSLSPRLLTYLS